MKTTKGECKENVEKTKRQYGDSRKTLIFKRESTTWGQHEENMDTTWRQQTTMREECDKNVGTTWRQRPLSARTKFREREEDMRTT